SGARQCSLSFLMLPRKCCVRMKLISIPKIAPSGAPFCHQPSSCAASARSRAHSSRFWCAIWARLRSSTRQVGQSTRSVSQARQTRCDLLSGLRYPGSRRLIEGPDIVIRREGSILMDQSELRATWEASCELDQTLHLRKSEFARLRRNQIESEPYLRSSAFERMARREVGIFRDMPILVDKQQRETTRDALFRSFSTQFPKKESSRVQVGPSQYTTRLPVREIMRRWSGGKAIVGVTDLHIRGTRVEKVIDTSAL